MEDAAYTRVPNAILDAMADFGHAEFRVILAIVRKTTGYHKTSDRLSVSQLAKLTGLTSRNVQVALTALLKRGVIGRTPTTKQGYAYALQAFPPHATAPHGDTEPCPVGIQSDNHIPTDTISLGDMVPYPLGIQFEEKPCPVGITQKKDSKEKRKSVAATPDGVPLSTTKKQLDPPPLEIRHTVAAGSQIDLTHGLKGDILQVNTTAAKLWRQRLPDETVAALAVRIRQVGAWIRKTQYPYAQHHEQRIPPAALVKFWQQAGLALAARASPTTTQYYQPPSRPSVEETAAAARALAESGIVR